MADQDEDKSSKTEEPSERKLQKAREQGNVPKSREVNSFFVLLAAVIALLLTFPPMMFGILDIYGGIFSDVGTMRMEGKEEIGGVLHYISVEAVWLLVPTFIVMVVFAYLGGFFQTGVIFSGEPIKPKLSKISLIKGMERMFSVKSLMEFVKSLLKMFVVGGAIYFVMYLNRDEFLLLVNQPVMDMVFLTQEVILQMLAAVLAIAALIAIVDFLFQKQQYIKDQRMTRRELKDEFKDSEGDPHIKSKQRQLRMEKAKARMMQELPNADVVVTNPTHYAVALRYDKSKEAAPRVIAKGVDYLALRIRAVAKENEIPLYEDPPLARQLYADVDLDDEIPLELYETVAKVVAYIYNVRGKKKAS